MKQKRLYILSFIYLAAALISLVVTVWDVIVLGLFAPAVDITGGLGVAMVCTLGSLAVCALLAVIGQQLRKKQFTPKTVKYGVALLAASILTFIFCLVGHYLAIPSAFGVLLPVATLLAIK